MGLDKSVWVGTVLSLIARALQSSLNLNLCVLAFIAGPLGSFELSQSPNEFYSPLGAVHAC